MVVGIISDVHSDYNSLKKAVAYLEKKNCDTLVCLGDIVGYNDDFTEFFKHGQAKNCVAFVLSEFDIVVMGNHDLYALRKLPLFDAGFRYPDNWYEMSLSQRKKLAGKNIWLYEDEKDDLLISKQLRDSYEIIPEFKTKYIGENLVMFSHYLHPDLSGSTTFKAKEYNEFSKHFAFMQNYECSIAFSGHTHPEGVEIVKDQQYRKFPFGEYSIGYGQVIVNVPCIAKGKIQNGVTIYHPSQGALEIISLQSFT